MTDVSSGPVVKPVSLEDLGDEDLSAMFGGFYWYRGPDHVRDHLRGSELLGAWDAGWKGIVAVRQHAHGMDVTPWTPAAPPGLPGRRRVLLALLARAKEIALSRKSKLFSRMRDVRGDSATAHVELLRAAGFRRTGVRCRMACEIDETVLGYARGGAGLLSASDAGWRTVADPESVLDLIVPCFRGSEDSVEADRTVEEWREWLAATRRGDRGTFLPQASAVLSIAGSPAGFYLGTDSTGELYLSDIGVLPEFRGRGFGSVLMARFLCAGQSLGYRSSILMVAAENVPAIRLYEKFGYKRTASLAVGEVDPGESPLA